MDSSRTQASARRRAVNRAHALKREHKRVRARPILADERVKITLRCHDRRLFLSPYGDPRKGRTADELRNFVGYVIGRAQLKYGFEFHGGVVMGDHVHYDTTDVRANRPRYKDSIHTCLARGINARLGRSDAMWSPGGSCDTTTPTDEENLRDLAYTDVNPVKAGLVKWGHLWPGFTTFGWRFGETRAFRRPDWFFDPDNPENPPVVTVMRVRPKGSYPDVSNDELSALLMRLCREKQREKQREMKAKHRRFMGLKKLARTKWWRQAVSWEDRFTTKPRVASADKWKRIEALQRNRDWARSYAKAYDEYCRGLDPVFPHGTYLMRVRYGVRVAERPP